EGIYYAIRSAQLAVPFILDALVAPGRPDFAAYQRAVDGELATDLESAWRLMRVYTLAPALFAGALGRSERLWRAITRLLRGELGYADVLRRLGPFRHL